MVTFKVKEGFFLLFALLTVHSADGLNHSPSTNPTLIVLGRSGTGISSTIQQIIGPSKTVAAPTGSPTSIKEFKVPTSSQGGYFTIVDVDGLVDGKNAVQDASVLASLKYYLQDPSGLNGALPNFFLIVSTFDDNRLDGPSSLFTQTVKRVEALQKSVYGAVTNNTILLLTKFMASTKSDQRRPKGKLDLFHSTLREYTEFTNSLDIVVGENKGRAYDLEIDSMGYTPLPNNELYPKNLFDKLTNISTLNGDQYGVNGIRDLTSSRQMQGKATSRFYSAPNPKQVESDQAEFVRKISVSDSNIQDSEINRALERSYNELNASSQAQAMSEMIELQAHFQSMSWTSITQLPTRALERVKFFQSLEGLNSQKLMLLAKAFGLKMPHLIQTPVVGYGYDILQDGILGTSPFVEGSWKPSPIGYLISDIVSCSKLAKMSKVHYNYFSENVTDYIPERYRFLGFENAESIISPTAFEGTVMSGFNLRPEDSETVVSLSAAQEIRSIECTLVDAKDLKDEFIEAVRSLTPFSSSDRDSESEWKGFFRNYGTHIVGKSYAGGYFEGSITSPSLKPIMSSKLRINETLEKINNFDRVPFEEKPSYRFYGGIKDARLEDVYELDSNARKELLQTWTSSLNYDPVMLPYELGLIPISVFAKSVDQNLGAEVERATSLLLRGDLVYKRPIKPKSNSTTKSTTTSRPSYVHYETTSPGHQSYYNTPSPPPVNNHYQHLPTVVASASKPVECPTQINPIINPTQATPTPTPTSAPIIITPKPIQRDFTEFTVGQGYHMMKEIVLPKSPFIFGGETGPIQSQRLKTPCEVINADYHDSLSDYLKLRLTRKFGVGSYLITEAVAENFEGKILPGNVFRNSNPKKRFKFEVERRFSEVKIVEKDLKTKTTEEFNRDVLALPKLLSRKVTCFELNEWKRFFDKFGTHYIKSTFVGFSFELAFNNVTENQAKNLLPFDSSNCKPYEAGQLGKAFNTLSTYGRLTVLKPTFEFQSYQDLLLHNGTLTHDFNEAMFQLMNNELNC